MMEIWSPRPQWWIECFDTSGGRSLGDVEVEAGGGSSQMVDVSKTRHFSRFGVRFLLVFQVGWKARIQFRDLEGDLMIELEFGSDGWYGKIVDDDLSGSAPLCTCTYVYEYQLLFEVLGKKNSEVQTRERYVFTLAIFSLTRSKVGRFRMYMLNRFSTRPVLFFWNLWLNRFQINFVRQDFFFSLIE